ncbi:MAG: hypothetical protein N3D11_12290 [Candidatus Sumerlaeia bacterium]|nr:hypothetical protein [Candidatus Sumerlaeia bacterium]
MRFKPRFSPIVMSLVCAALWLAASPSLYAQITTAVLPLGSVPADPLIKRKGEILLLINQAKEELLFNRPAEAKLKCEQVLAIDPENPDARFILAQAERQLKSAAAGRRTAISSLPDASKLQEAVERSRPTTSVVVLPSDRMSSPPAVRSAVADPREGIAPRPAPVWISQKYLVGAAVALMAVLGFILAMMIWERLTSGKRHRAAQAQLFEHMRAISTHGQNSGAGFDVPEGFSRLAADDDFSLGVPTPSPRAAASAPSSAPAAGKSAPTAPIKPAPVAAAADDEAVDIWGAAAPGKPAAPRPAPSAPAPQAPAPSAPPEEEQELIPATSIFGEEVPPPRPAPPPQPASVAPPKPVPPAPPFPAPVATAPPIEDEGPIPLEGILARSSGLPGYREAEEESSEVASTLQRDPFLFEEMDIKSGSPQARIEEVPFALDASFDQTLLDEEQEEPVSKPVLPSPEEASTPEEVKTIHLGDDDFPLGGGETLAAEPPLGSGPLPLAGYESPAPSPPVSPDVIEEILFSPDVPPSPALDKTVVDDQARQKALFHDQLARGLAAMERGNWSEAVKFLSVAHAMDPGDSFAREKLREAREKKG